MVPETRLREVIGAMFAAHPYEEVAYDLCLLKNQAPGKAGLGRIGRLPDPKPLHAFAEQVGDALGLQALRLVGDSGGRSPSSPSAGGAAMSLLKRALEAGADVYLTGDVKHHDALNALGQGIAVIDAGHHATEKIIVPAMAKYLAEKAALAGSGWNLTSRINTDPFLNVYPGSWPAMPAPPSDRAGEPAAAVKAESMNSSSGGGAGNWGAGDAREADHLH